METSIKGDEAYCFNLSTGAMSTISLPIIAHDIFSMPTLGAFVTETGSTYNNEKYYYEATLIDITGNVIRVFDDVIPSTFYHHPTEKIVFFFSGYQPNETVVATAINYYEYENDKLITVDIDDVGFEALDTYMDFNPNDDFLYWSGDHGVVYKIDTKDMKNVVSGSEGFVFNNSGDRSAKYGPDAVKIYSNGTLDMTIPHSDLPFYRGYSVELHWYDDDYLILMVGGMFISCNIKIGTYTETTNLGRTYTFSKATKTFYRAIVTKKSCTLETIDVSTCLHKDTP